MTFATPLALLALPLIPLVIVALVMARRRRIRYAIRYPALDVLAGVVERERRGRWIPAALLVLALAALLLGAARPMARVPVPRDEATVMLVIDVSGSMNADDVEPTRMEAAQRAASRFLDRLPERFQVGLVTFSSEAETLVPPTTDREAVRSALAMLHANGGTAMGDGLARALDTIESARQQATGGPSPSTTTDPSAPGSTTPTPATPDSGAAQPAPPPAVTLLLSDGANSAGGDPFVQAERARQLRVPVYTIALGTAGGVLRQPNAFGGTRIQPVPPDPDSLARIAETSNGRFFEAPTSDNLTAVYDSLGSRIGFRFEEREVTVAFTVAGLLLLAAAGALRARRGARLP
ncbi:MAG TPA: VWA domain-containing protein [Actinomycetota bacterium]|jgi:Ca-activated chloride channel family protein|nr:VWA domain-containing protein [Actinomycetota bacterium]